MKKYALGVFCALSFVMISWTTVSADPTDGTFNSVGDTSSFMGTTEGRQLPLLCDNSGYQWNLEVVGKGQLSGTVSTGSCGVYRVTGTFDAITVRLRADGGDGARCVGFTYTGIHKGTSGSGAWMNDAGGSGTWTMSPCTVKKSD
ncbi:MAG: hypothetical protein MRJ65_17165 [Candidatus Brocadiaceae bacterium]|nr:hypothetical protein [Candidatus Brocadiaceae bacterium]